MGNLNDLGSTPLSDNVDVANLPAEMGGYTPAPPSGSYRFQLPKLGPEAFEKMTTTNHGERVSVVFGDDTPLKIVQAPAAASDQYLNTPFQTRLNNAPRKRGKGDDAPMASDWDYLNRALGEKDRPKSNLEFAQRLIAQAASGTKTFGADIEGSYFCNDKRDARFDDGTGALSTIPQVDGNNAPVLDGAGLPVNIKGCGARYYEGDASAYSVNGDRKGGKIGKVNGAYPNTVTCLNPDCQANMRRFANLTRFKE